MHKMLRNWGEKFPATTLSYSMAKAAPPDDAFPEIFKLIKASPIEARSITAAKGKKGREKGKVKNNLNN